MKNLSLILFAALILLGWTSLAAGAIAALAGEPVFVSSKHDHHVPLAPEPESPPLRAGAQECPAAPALDASVPCEV